MNKTKTALVTGGSRGLGRDMAINLAKKGLDVILTYHTNKEKASEVVKEIQSIGQHATAFQLDTRDIGSFNAFYSEVAREQESRTGNRNIDFLINNAGTGIYAPITETSEAQFDDLMNIHFKGVFFLTQKALAQMNDGGGIVNISSGLARFSIPGFAAYGAMKGAIDVFTRYLASELGGRQITANVVAPGAVATDFGGGANRDDEETRGMISSLTPLGRVGEAEDIGGVVAFLCTEEAGWINGQRIEVSGGILS